MDQNQEKKLTVSRADWTLQVRELLAPAIDNERALAGVGRQVVEGAATAFIVEDDGDLVAAFVLRVDDDEGVVVAAGGKGRGYGLIDALLPAIEARFHGCRAIRFHTARPGLARLMLKNGYVGQEVVMCKELNSGGVH